MLANRMSHLAKGIEKQFIKTSNHLDGLSHGLELSAPARPLTTVASYSQTSAVVVPTKLANIVT